jgi:hypothetical protein
MRGMFMSANENFDDVLDRIIKTDSVPMTKKFCLYQNSIGNTDFYNLEDTKKYLLSILKDGWSLTEKNEEGEDDTVYEIEFKVEFISKWKFGNGKQIV